MYTHTHEKEEREDTHNTHTDIHKYTPYAVGGTVADSPRFVLTSLTSD